MENSQIGKQIGNLLDMPKRPQAQQHIFSVGGWGGGGNIIPWIQLLNKIDFKKGLDSEDADRRDSINHLIFSSFCRADEKLYDKPFCFSLPYGKTQTSV